MKKKRLSFRDVLILICTLIGLVMALSVKRYTDSLDRALCIVSAVALLSFVVVLLLHNDPKSRPQKAAVFDGAWACLVLSAMEIVVLLRDRSSATFIVPMLFVTLMLSALLLFLFFRKNPIRYSFGQVNNSEIDSMDGHDFEYYCAEILRRNGYTHVEVTPASGDQGVDVLAVKNGKSYAIQCKRYSNDLDNTPIQEVVTGRMVYGCDYGVVMTNQYFTDSAVEAARATGTILWDRDELMRMKRISGM